MSRLFKNVSSFLVAISVFIVGSCAEARRMPELGYTLGVCAVTYSITEEQTSVKGVHINDKMEKVNKLLGVPDDVYKYGDRKRYKYGNLIIEYLDGYVYRMYLGQGLSTFDGVRIGMPESALYNVYGVADVVHIDKYITPKLPLKLQEAEGKFIIPDRLKNGDTQKDWERKIKMWERFNKTVYEYRVHERLWMSFTVVSGIINDIEVHWSE